MTNKLFQKELETCFDIYPELEKILYKKEYKHNPYPDLDIAMELILRRISNGEEWRDLSWIEKEIEEEINAFVQKQWKKNTVVTHAVNCFFIQTRKKNLGS